MNEERREENLQEQNQEQTAQEQTQTTDTGTTPQEQTQEQTIQEQAQEQLQTQPQTQQNQTQTQPFPQQSQTRATETNPTIKYLELRLAYEDFLNSEEGKEFSKYKREVLEALREDLQKGVDLPEKLDPKSYIFAKLGEKIIRDRQVSMTETPETTSASQPTQEGSKVKDMKPEEFERFWEQYRSRRPVL